ncbi:hypothetical protein [Methanococcoides methylutens]|uniref:hypothetical protein n=1 Tax=Methanococcoides methylutens TaxID=2226 RepID=UPI00064EA55F|nr:hypothetical protein [Methanococcoides methylutens]
MVGVLERKHVHADGVVYIGKEANNIDEQELDVKQAQLFVDVGGKKRKVLEMPQKEAEICGVGRSMFQANKQRIREGKKIDWKTPAVERLL